MTHYRRVGRVPPKRHTVHRDADGQRLAEELMGTNGFSGASSLLYHRCSPSALLAVEAVADGRGPLRPNHPVVPLHLRTGVLGAPPGGGGDLIGSRHVLAGNADLTLVLAVGADPGPLYRNAVGDELVFVHEGSARLESVFGSLAVGPGDYVVVPAGTTHRWVPEGTVRALVLEAAGHVSPPRKHLTPGGQFAEHAPYCERDLRAPDEPLVIDTAADGPVDVLVRTASGLSRHRHAHHPFDVVGWDGCLYPWALSIRDFEPIVGSRHQPPPVHQTFEGPGFVVCSFVPRPFDFGADAVKIPYHHANVDSDEVLFYVGGDFMSRAGSGIGVGSVTLHPAGFVHGPQPGSWERSVDQDATDETAVMVDTFRPLLLGPAADAAVAPGYLTSWSDV
ncbi:MAG: homogentisate 1,2-dioxygenase [Acidimicrobiales bacterium]|nr:homogentisate 1,2-dioxygenase [Acidimicrobiales bacterium]